MAGTNKTSAARARANKKFADALPDALPGIASNHIFHLAAILWSGMLVVLYCRVSTCWQEKNGNLKDQEEGMMQKLEQLGVKVSCVFRETGSGKKSDRPILLAAAECAQKRGAILVAFSTERFIRSVDYQGNGDVLPTEAEYETLISSVGGVVLATVFHPDEDPGVVRGEESKRGQEAKSKGGRPEKNKPGDLKKRRQKYSVIVRVLKSEGKSNRWISRYLVTPENTIRRWLK